MTLTYPTMIGWRGAALCVRYKNSEYFVPAKQTPHLLNEYALVELFRAGADGPECVGSMFPDRDGKEILVALDDRLFAAPWQTIAAMKRGDTAMVEETAWSTEGASGSEAT